MKKELRDYLSPDNQRKFANVVKCANDTLNKPVDLAFTDHTIAHKKIVHAHLDSFLGPWLAEQAQTRGAALVEKEVLILLCAAYLHDIGMQMVHPDALAVLPSLTDEERKEAAALPKDGISAEHRDFVRRHHGNIAHDWISGSCDAIADMPPLHGLEGLRNMVAQVAWAHCFWLSDSKSHEVYTQRLQPVSEPEGNIRLDLLAAFLRLADILDQDKRRVDLIDSKRLALPLRSKIHWWRHHYVNACRIETNIGHAYPLTVAFRLPKAHETQRDWMVPALYSATIKEIEAELLRIKKWLGEAGIHIAIPTPEACSVTIDHEAQPMPADVLAAFQETWREADGAMARAEILIAAETGNLSSETMGAALPGLAAAIEIEEYFANAREEFVGEFRNTPYSPLDIKLQDQPELVIALDHLEKHLQTAQTEPYPIILVGNPGGGKTMLLKRYVWEWSCGKRGKTPMPVYIQATRFGSAQWASDVETRLGGRENPCSEQAYQAIVAETFQQLEQVIARTLCELARLPTQHEAAMRAALTDALARTPMVIFFDGINELPPMLRSLAAWAINVFVQRYYRIHRVVVSSRIGDFRPLDFPAHRYCELAPMTARAVRDYWLAVGVGNAAIQRFFDAAAPGMRDLVQTPMAAYMAGELLKLGDDEFVNSQGKLFQRYVKESLRHWFSRLGRTPHSQLSAAQAHALLAEIAYQAFDVLQVSFGDRIVLAAIKEWLNRLDVAEMSALNLQQMAQSDLARQLLAELLSTGFLLQSGDCEHGVRVLRFRHHTFQDYFAAVSIASRWDDLARIVARPVFHEALGLLAGVVDEPARFIARLGDATSDQWGFVALLPLLFRVIGTSQVPVPRNVLLRVFSATIPIYSAAQGILSPFAAEVLIHMFSQVDWQLLAQFLGFIANAPERPEWERELARVDAIKALNQDMQETPPSETSLRAFFASRIPPEILADHEAAKMVLELRVKEKNAGSSLEQVPLLLAGIAGSLYLSPEQKVGLVFALASASPNQLGALQSVFVAEICEYGAMNFQSPGEHIVIQTLLTYGYAGLMLLEEDGLHQAGSANDLDAYLAAWDRLGCKLPLFQRLIWLSAEMSPSQLQRMFDHLPDLESMGCLVLRCGMPTDRSWPMGGKPKFLRELVAAIKGLASASSNPFLVAWLYRLLAEPVPNDRQRCLEPQVIAAGAAGCFLLECNPPWELPAALSYYKSQQSDTSMREAIAKLLAGDELGFQKSLVARGLNEQVALKFLAAAENDTACIAAIAHAIFALDKSIGKSAQLEAAEIATRTATPKEVNRLIDDFGLTVSDIFNSNLCFSNPLDGLLLHLASHRKTWQPDTSQYAPKNIRHLKWLAFSNKPEEAYRIGMEILTRDVPTDPRMAGTFHQTLKTARQLQPEIGTNPRIQDLFENITPILQQGYLIDAFCTAAQDAVNNGETSAQAIATITIAALSKPARAARRSERIKLIALLAKIDPPSIARHLPLYLSLRPRAGEAAGGYLGSGGWYCYLAGDVEGYLDLTEQALVFCPDADWLLGNRALAMHLLQRPTVDVMAAYRRAAEATSSVESWNDVAINDLKAHGERFGVQAIPSEFIAEVAALYVDRE